MDKDLEMITVLAKIAAALSKSEGHTVEIYKAEESTPPFRVYLTTTEEGNHAVVLVHDGGFCISPRNGVLVSGGYAKPPNVRTRASQPSICVPTFSQFTM